MPQITQQHRFLRIDTVLAENTLILTHLQGVEGISNNFVFSLSVISEQADLAYQSLLGTRVAFTLIKENSEITYNALVWHISPVNDNDSRGINQYEMMVVPWFECLKLNIDNRVFHHQTVTEIFSTICKELNFYDFDFTHLQKTYPPLPHCVQYQESSLAFLQRLLAENGIFYYFIHSKKTHVLCLADNIQSMPCIEGNVAFRHHHGHHIYEWQPEYKLLPKQVCYRCYDFLSPNHALLCAINNKQQTLENPLVDYHFAKYVDLDTGKALAKQRLAVATWQARQITGKSNIFTFSSAKLFTFEDKQRYFLLSISHKAHDTSHLVEQKSNSLSQHYENQFSCIHSENVFYPPIPKQDRHVGKSYHFGTIATANDTELDTNSYGQVKLHYLWERFPKPAENIVQMARVSQAYQGKYWRGQFIPRQGQEIVIGHLNGNFAEPVVIGTLYNNCNLPPYPLPDSKNLSVIKTHSLNNENSKVGNKIILDDTPGNEAFSISAQRDYKIDVQHDYIHQIKGDENITITTEYLLKLLNGSADIKAHEIHLCVKDNILMMNQQGISINGKVQLLAKGAGATLPVARVGDDHKCPKKCDDQPHEGGPILQGASTVLANGMPIARIEDLMHCRGEDDEISTGMVNIKIQGKAIARVHDQTKHGGMIKSGSNNVLVGDNSD